MAAGQSCYNDRIPTSFEHMTDDLNSFYEGFDPHELKRMVHGALTHGNVCFLRTIAKTNCLKDIVKEAQFYIHSIGSVTAFAYYLNAHPKDREGVELMMDIFDRMDPDGKAMQVALITGNKYALDVFKQSLIIGDKHTASVSLAIERNNFDMMEFLLPHFGAEVAGKAIQQIVSKEWVQKSYPNTMEELGERALVGVNKALAASPNHQEAAQWAEQQNFPGKSIFQEFYRAWVSEQSKKELEAHVGGMGLASKPSKM